MRWSRRRTVAALLAAVGVAALAIWLARPDAHGIARPRFDPTKARAISSSRIERAKQLVAALHAVASAHARPALPAGSDAPAATGSDVQPFSHLHREFVDPRCTFGPRALCDALLPLIDSCDAGSATDCVALADYLADTPPRELISIVVYIRACKLGDQPSCDRVADLKKPSDEPCDKDPFACEWRAYRAGSAGLEQTEQACTLGAAESCMFLANKTTDKAAAQAYIETSCQLGNPIACMALAKALEVRCIPNETNVWCFPPDEAERREAKAMACDAGWLTGSDCN